MSSLSLSQTLGRAARALDGLKVVEVATFVAGPFCSSIFAEHGAEVIKVELPVTGDPLRKVGTMTACGATLQFLNEQRNKKSVTIDLRKPEGAELFKELVADADVVVENFQVETLERWGLGWDVLKALNPRLVMVRITGFGYTGPYRDRPGFGRIANAFGGLSFLTGEPDRPPANPGTVALGDYFAGLYGALGAMFALNARDRTGEGQMVDISLYEPIFRILDELAPAYQQTSAIRQRMGASSFNAVPHSHYETGDGRWVAIACTSDKLWQRLTDAMGRNDLDRFATFLQRHAARQEVDGLVGAWTQSLTRDEVLTVCAQYDIPAGPVLAIDEIFEDPHYRERETIARIADERLGDVAVPGVVIRLSETPGGVDHLGPDLGAHNDEILGGRLGLSTDRLEALRAAGAI